MRYRLRTLLIVLAMGPPAIAAAWLACVPYERHVINMLVPVIFVALSLASFALFDWVTEFVL